MTGKDCPETSQPLMDRTRSTDSAVQKQALSELAIHYGPFVHQVAQRFIRNKSDAEECAAKFVADQLLPGSVTRTYEPEKGPFRRYLVASIKHACQRFCEIQKRDRGRIRDLGGFVPDQIDHSADNGPFNAEDLIWAKTHLAMAVSRAKSALIENGTQDAWDILFKWEIGPKLFGLEKPAMEELEKSYSSNSDQIHGKVTTGKRAIRRQLEWLCTEIFQENENDWSIMAQTHELLSRVDAFVDFSPEVIQSFGLDEISCAIFLSRGKSAEFLEWVNDDISSDAMEWKKTLERQTSELGIKSRNDETIGELLHSRDSSLEELTALRRVAKQHIAATDSNIMSSENATRLYCLAIASGLAHRGERTSELATWQIIRNLTKMRDSKVIDRRSRELIDQAIESTKRLE